MIDKMFVELMKEIKESKPNDRSEKDRYVAILLTELEKIYAFFKIFVLGE